MRRETFSAVVSFRFWPWVLLIIFLAVAAWTIYSTYRTESEEILRYYAADDHAVHPFSGRVIALDPGHGGVDGGVSDEAAGLLEKTVTLNISTRLARLLSASGAEVVLTRREDRALAVGNREDLLRRVEAAENAGAEIFLSIHVNSFPQSQYFGGQTFYHPESEEGKRLAALLQEELIRIQPENFRTPQQADYVVLTAIEVPSVVVEVGFITNADDRRRLSEEASLEAIAQALYRGISRFFQGEEGIPSAVSKINVWW